MSMHAAGREKRAQKRDLLKERTGLTRRDFVITATTFAGGLAVACKSRHSGDAKSIGGTIQSIAAIKFPNAWIAVSKDGDVVFTLDKVEMGQGTMTTLASIVAEEVGVDPAKVTVQFAPPDKIFINNEFFVQVTGGSNSIASTWQPLRLAAAATRDMLLQGAAKQMGVNAKDCAAENGRIVHKPTGKDVGLGDIAEYTAHNIKPPSAPVPKPQSQYKVLGKPVKRLDSPDKVTGKAAYGIDVFNAGQEWNKALLQNEGRPSGALQMRQGKDGFTPTLTDEQFDRLKGEVEANYSGSANAGKPLLLDSALEWVQMSLNSKDMDHRETMLTNARFIAACYGTPPQLVNIPGESTYSNYEQATMAYWGDTVLPLLGTLLEDLNRWLPPLFGKKCFLWYDEEQLPALEPRRAEKAKRINLSEYMTVNEKREAMGLEAYAAPAHPGADSIFVSAKDIPVEMAGSVDPNLHPTLAGEENPDAPAKPTTAKDTQGP